MPKFFSAILFLSLSLLVACSESTQTPAGEPSQRPARDQLSQAQAEARKARVSQISYVIAIDLVSQPDAYTGTVSSQFHLSDASTNLDVDFTGGTVSAVVVNGQDTPVDYNGFFITLPTSALQQGMNDVTITYSHPFGQDGSGLHRFVDPEDDRTYLYTYLWPYYSNRLFPNFDQPNLKATYELTVRAADDWQVVSAMPEDSITSDGGTRLWHFPQSELFSSYVFSLHAGPYEIWEDDAGNIPLRLMARQSLAQYVDADEWFDYTRAGLAHYQDYFDIPYPFYKYDQLIVPDFLIGAMENVAAVTFSESYVDRGAGTRFGSQRRANTILHEMAHMWFGDLVTKNWWNGLWLNESFATLMASIAVAESTEFDDQWHDFYLSENLTAIRADNAVSTHAIEMPVNSTSEFFAVFDAITYDKGASVLNQLSHFIGQEDFRLGVSNYLKEHASGNTDLADFILSLSVQSNVDLTPWAQNWLYKAGVNTLEARYSCDADVIDSFAILQTASDELPTLREQRVQVGLMTENSDGAVALATAIPVVVSGAETPVPDALGLPCPVLAYPNYGGWGYTEVSLADNEIATVVESDLVNNIADPLLRSMVWTAVLEAPGNGQLAIEALLEMLVSSLGRETNERIVRQTQSALIATLNNLDSQIARLQVEPAAPGLAARVAEYTEQRARFGVAAEERLWTLIQAGVSDVQSESQLNLRVSNYIDLARSEAALNNLIGLLREEVTLSGTPAQQNVRWQIVSRLAVVGHEEASAFLFDESARDNSDAGRLAAIAAEAALPTLEIKQQWVNQILATENTLPLSHLRAAMGSLFPAGQADLQIALLPQLLTNLNTLATTRDPYFLRSYGDSLFAGICSEEGLGLLREAIVDSDAVGVTLYKFMSVNVQRAEACLAFGAE